MNASYTVNYHAIDLSTWKRKEHFHKWIQFDEPFHGIIVRLDMTSCKSVCQEKGYKVFDRYMYHFVNALNVCPPMRYRLQNGQPVIYDEAVSGLVVLREDDTFAYGQLVKTDDFISFQEQMKIEKQRVIDRGTLHDPDSPPNLTHVSVLPWTDFLGLSHARRYGTDDSIPKITFGKITRSGEGYFMPISVHVHHALVDGKDVADFINVFQGMLDE